MNNAYRGERTFHPPVMSFENPKKYLPSGKIVAMTSEYAALDPFDLRQKLERRLRELQA